MKEKDATQEDLESQESKSKRTIKTKYDPEVNYFDVLEVNENSTLKEIKRSYRKLTRKYHPDALAQANLTDEQLKKAEEKHHLISIARDILLDETLKKEWQTKHRAILERKKKAEAETAERRIMRERLEAREAEAAKQDNQLSSYEQKMALAKHIRETGGYAELDVIQREYEQQQRHLSKKSVVTTENTKDTELLTLKVVWKKRHADAKKLSSKALKVLLEDKFGPLDHCLKTSGKRLAIIQFSSLKSVSTALACSMEKQREHPLHPSFYFKFTSMSQ
mmetsp:Transcript_397/g.729  ORF Transcript_397/g.729 Transcript_397/m.729 type:complete len:278 (-) Transcript_397:21-854(-)